MAIRAKRSSNARVRSTLSLRWFRTMRMCLQQRSPRWTKRGGKSALFSAERQSRATRSPGCDALRRKAKYAVSDRSGPHDGWVRNAWAFARTYGDDVFVTEG